jgi:hypothetical protein
MKKELFLNCIKLHCVFLEEEGYKFSWVERRISYSKNTENDGLQISFGWTKYSDTFHIHGIEGAKRINDIEKVIHKELDGNFEDYYTIYETPKNNLPEEILFRHTPDNYHFDINSEKDIIIFSEFLKSYYINNLKDFNEKFQTIQQIDEWLNNHDINLHQSFLYFDNNTMMLRKLVIMKLCNNQNFTQLYNQYKDFLHQKFNEKANPYDRMYISFIKFDYFFQS